MARKPDFILGRPLRVINLGIEGFAADLSEVGVNVVHVDWQPPAGGSPGMLALLERITEGTAKAEKRVPRRRRPTTRQG
jgi:hypothetical protein